MAVAITFTFCVVVEKLGSAKLVTSWICCQKVCCGRHNSAPKSSCNEVGEHGKLGSQALSGLITSNSVTPFSHNWSLEWAEKTPLWIPEGNSNVPFFHIKLWFLYSKVKYSKFGTMATLGRNGIYLCPWSVHKVFSSTMTVSIQPHRDRGGVEKKHCSSPCLGNYWYADGDQCNQLYVDKKII